MAKPYPESPCKTKMLSQQISATPLPSVAPAPRWYAAYTLPRHEKVVTQQLAQKSVESYLPLYEATHRWKDRRAQVQLPLFPGYVFVHLSLNDRIRVLEVSSVLRLVSFNGMAA